MHRAALPLFGLLLTTLAGCASTQNSSGGTSGATPAYVEGTWTGGASTEARTMVMVLKQTGNNVMGTLSGAGVSVDGRYRGYGG
jgi:outer membrane lipoprotein SlyB